MSYRKFLHPLGPRKLLAKLIIDLWHTTAMHQFNSVTLLMHGRNKDLIRIQLLRDWKITCESHAIDITSWDKLYAGIPLNQDEIKRE